MYCEKVKQFNCVPRQKFFTGGVIHSRSATDKMLIFNRHWLLGLKLYCEGPVTGRAVGLECPVHPYYRCFWPTWSVGTLSKPVLVYTHPPAPLPWSWSCSKTSKADQSLWASTNSHSSGPNPIVLLTQVPQKRQDRKSRKAAAQFPDSSTVLEYVPMRAVVLIRAGFAWEGAWVSLWIRLPLDCWYLASEGQGCHWTSSHAQSSSQ